MRLVCRCTETQQRYHCVVTTSHRPLARCFTICGWKASSVVCPAADQNTNSFGVAVHCRYLQRRTIRMVDVHSRAVVEQFPHHVTMTMHGSHEQCRGAVPHASAAPIIDSRALFVSMLQQYTDSHSMPSLRSSVQRAQALRIDVS
jgi:hypothetical protein